MRVSPTDFESSRLLEYIKLFMIDGEGIPGAWPMLVWTGAAIELPVSISKTVAMLNETVSFEKPVRKNQKRFVVIKGKTLTEVLKNGFH